MARRKRVFILGGGAGLGAHHVGALRYLEEEGIKPDEVAIELAEATVIDRIFLVGQADRTSARRRMVWSLLARPPDSTVP